jgi:hypothetical protein
MIKKLMKSYAKSVARMHALGLKVEEEGYGNVKIRSLKLIKNKSSAICEYLLEKKKANEICSKIISIMRKPIT